MVNPAESLTSTDGAERVLLKVFTEKACPGYSLVRLEVSYDSDPGRVHEVLLAVATAHPLVVKEPAPAVLFLKFGDSALEFEVRVFVRELANRLPLTHELHNLILRALRANRIEIPFPQREVHLRGVPAGPRNLLDKDSSPSS